MTAADTSAFRHERRTLNSATLTSGAEQVIDFVLPLFAGAVLGLSAGETGLLIAASQLVAFAVRPLAGVVVDRADRSVVASIGAGGYGIGCGLYAMSTGLPVALAAAVVTGAAGAFLWVAIRAIIGERLPVDSGVFAKLVAAEETGGWLILVPAIIVLSITDYLWVFIGIAVCCLVAAADLLSTRNRRVTTDSTAPAGAELSSVSLAGLGGRLRPMLLAVAVTMAAEAAISLLLILHLQRGFGLGVAEIAYVFLPGAIAMSILPSHLHRLVVRFGRRRMLTLGALASALFAVGLAFAPGPAWVAALWILSAVAWAAVIPVQQAVIAEAVGRAHLGRGMSLYEAACLAGAFTGSLAAGFLYESGSWLLACAVCAAIIASGAALVPAAVKRLGVTNWPAGPHSAPEPAGEGRAPAPAAEEATAETKTPKSRRKLLTDFAAHSALLAAAVAAAWVAVPDFSLATILGIGPDSVDLYESVRSLLSGGLDMAALTTTALRVWVVIYAIDLIWTAWKTLEPRSERQEQPSR
ncbi:MFS transporter [Nonomuraea ceibae]|uniref:MFS transporter n=1 Tax=Nonomuraea ceibae TaxID=1935170 RepID=UPI001C606B3F|nr:MFS transporter [Nonomuraea ceibae]